MALKLPRRVSGTGPAPRAAFTPAAARSPYATRQVTTPVDYRALLASDPTLAAALGQINTQGVSALAGLTGGEQQLYGRLGESPDMNSPYFTSLPPQLQQALRSVVTPELQGVIGQANQAGTSTLAQLAHGYQQTQAGDEAVLAARGLAHSGALRQFSDENLRNYTLGQYQARQSALDNLGQLQNSYLGTQGQLQGQAASAVSDANQRISDQINNGLLAPTTGTVATYQPRQNPSAPSQVFSPLAVGSQTSYEPKPTAANYAGPKLGAAPSVSFSRQAA